MEVFNIQSQLITLSFLNFDINGAIFKASSPLNIYAQDIYSTTEYLKAGFVITPECTEYEDNMLYGELTFVNLKFAGTRYEPSYSGLLVLNTLNNVTL